MHLYICIFAQTAAALSPRAHAARAVSGRVFSDDVANQEEVEDEEVTGAGIFGGSSSSSSRPSSVGGGRVGDRKVKYKGKWYTESEIAVIVCFMSVYVSVFVCVCTGT